MRDPRAIAMTEAVLEDHVRQLCADLGLARFHVRHSRGMTPGWPDDVIVGRCGVLFRELKSECGVLTPEQRAVGAQLTRAGANWSTWRPRDLLDGTIARQLTDLAAIQLELPDPEATAQ